LFWIFSVRSPLAPLRTMKQLTCMQAKRGQQGCPGFFFFSLAATLSTQRRARCRRCAALQVNLRPPRRIQCAAALQRPHLVGARIARPDADHVREGGVADPALPRVQDPAAVHLRAPAAVAGQGGARIMRMHLT